MQSPGKDKIRMSPQVTVSFSLYFFLAEGYPSSNSNFATHFEDETSDLLLRLRRILVSENSCTEFQQTKTPLDRRVVVIIILSLLCGYFKKAVDKVYLSFLPILNRFASGIDDEDENGEKLPAKNQGSVELRCSVWSLHLI